MFCAYTRPRFQVSGYRSIGPLVYAYCSANRFVCAFLLLFFFLSVLFSHIMYTKHTKHVIHTDNAESMLRTCSHSPCRTMFVTLNSLRPPVYPLMDEQ